MHTPQLSFLNVGVLVFLMVGAITKKMLKLSFAFLHLLSIITSVPFPESHLVQLKFLERVPLAHANKTVAAFCFDNFILRRSY